MKIKKLLNLALTVLVTFALVFSSLVFANAAEVTEVGTADEFAAAIKNTSVSAIKLTADIESNIAEQKNITRTLSIDGAGYTLTGQLYVKNGGNLTIENLTVKFDSAPVQVYGSGNLTMIGGKADRYSGTGQALWVDENHSGTVYLTGGAWLYNNSDAGSATFTVGTSKNGKYILENCKIENASSSGAVDFRKGTATIELGGSTEGKCELISTGNLLRSSETTGSLTLIIKDGAELVTKSDPAINCIGTTNITMTGGYIKGASGSGINMTAAGSVEISDNAKFESTAGNCINVDTGSSANVSITGGSFTHTGAGSVVKHQGVGSVSMTGVTVTHTGNGNVLFVSDGGVEGVDKTVTLNACNFTSKNETMKFETTDGSSIMVYIVGTENTFVKSLEKDAISYTFGVEFIDVNSKLARYNNGSDVPAGPVRLSNLLEIEYNSKQTGNYLINEFTATAGKTYQFDIDYKAQGDVEPSIKLQYNNGSDWVDLTETATKDNVNGAHKSVTITVPANAKATGNNVRVIIGDTAFKGIGKLMFANAKLKVSAKDDNLIPNGDFSMDTVAENVATLNSWTKANDNANMVLNVKKLYGGYFDSERSENMVVVTPNQLNASNITVLSQTNITLEAGATYQVDFDVKSAYQTTLAALTLNYKDATNAWNSIAATATSKNVEGKHYSYKFTMPATGVAEIENFQIALPVNTVNGGAIYFGNFVLVKLDGEKTVGYNYLNNGDFKIGKAAKITVNNWANNLYGWDINADVLGKATVETYAMPKGFFEGTRTSKMVEIVHSNVGTKPGISQELFLEKGVTYRFDVDYTSTNTTQILISLKYAKDSGYTTIAKTATADTITGKHVSYEFTLPNDARMTGTGNFEILLGEDSTSGKGNVYFANAKLRKVEAGNVIGENLLTNGDFSFGEFTNVTDTNSKVQLHGWTLVGNTLANAESITLMEITKDFFEPLKAVAVKNSKGNITLLETVKSGKTYIFSYECKYSSSNKATPYIVAITNSGTKVITPTEITENLGGKNNVSVMFTMPNNLVNSKNIRIGLAFNSKDISGTFSNFVLKETDKFLMATGENIILDSRFKSTDSIVDYSATAAESVWMKDGEFDTAPEITIVKDDHFTIKTPYVMVAAGMNVSDFQTTSGNGAYLSQVVTLQKDKTYRLSYNVKYASEGRGDKDKKGITIEYQNSRLRWGELEATQLPVANEYKEVYVFTAPSDIRSTDNTRVLLHISSAYVSGYFSNFSIVEIDAEGNTISDEIMVNGDFVTGDSYGWTQSGSLGILDFAPMPENFFNKVTPNAPHMLKYYDSSDWAHFDQNMMLKPSTKYEVIFDVNHTHYRENNMPDNSIDMWYYITKDDGSIGYTNGTFNPDVAVPERNKITIEKINENGTQRWVLETAPNIRSHSNMNIILRLYMRTGSAGYFGNIQMYELDSEGNRVGNNIVLNGDWTLGFAAWKVEGTSTNESVEMPSADYLKKIPKPEKMVESKGTAQNQTYSSTVTINAEKKHYFTGIKIDMNGAGITPEVQYRSIDADGEFVTLDADIYYNSDRYDFEVGFTLPDDAIVVNGKAEVRVQINNGIKGKGYFADLMFREEGKYTNLAKQFVASGDNYQTVKYSDDVFVFYYDDTKFEDGDWSGELADAIEKGVVSEIRGKLVDSSGKPIKNAKIKLAPANKIVKTDANGEFRFDGIKTGSYSIYYIDESGAELAIYTDLSVFPATIVILPTATYLRGDEIQVPMDDEIIDDTEEPYGALRGYLFDESGNPVANARIYIRGNGYAVTNEQGIFEFANLPVGEFDVYEMLVDGTEVVYRTVKIEAYKGTVIKISREAEGFNWLLVIIPAIAVVVLASGTMAAILIFKKKKK